MLVLTACTKSDDDSNNIGSATPTAGTWKISYFFDKKDETSDYTAYAFTFGTNGSLSVSNGSQSWQGTWRTGVDDSKDKLVINLNGSLPSALSELEEDWLIVSMDDTFMHLQHVSGGGGDTEILHFRRK